MASAGGQPVLRVHGAARRQHCQRCGPVIGGVILAAFTGPDGWRSVFYVNVPIGLAALLLAARFVPSRTVAVRAASTWTWSGRCCSAVVCSACCCRWWRLRPAVWAACDGCSGWRCCCSPASPGESCARCARGGRRCSTRGCCASPALPPDWASAWSTQRSYWHLARVRVVLPGRAGLLAAALRFGRDPVRARDGGLRGDRRPAGGPGRALADGLWAGHDDGRAGRHGAAAAARWWERGGVGDHGAAAGGRARRRLGHFTQPHADLQYVPVRMPAQRAAPCKPPSASARRSAQPYWPRSSTRSSPIPAVTTR